MENISENPFSSRKNVSSQFGEDGVIEEIFRRIKTENQVCVEFGAWDGKWLSNTWDLWHNKGWSAILIEADAERARLLKEDTQSFPQVKSYNALVTASGENSLDNLLTKLEAPANFDLLSIDIDGDDYYIFEHLEKFTPRVVIIEFNPTIPPELEMVQDHGEYFGASALALVKLAQRKGYGLVCCTDCNCFFVRHADYPLLGITEPSLDEVFIRDHLTYVFTSFDGRPFLNKKPIFASTLESATLGNFIKSRWRARFLKHPKVAIQNLEEILPVRLFRA